MNDKKAILFAVTAALFWSTVATVFEKALMHYNVLEMLLYSSIFSFLILSIVGIGKGVFLTTFQVGGKYHFRSVILGALNPAIYYLVLFKAYDLLPAQEAQTLNYSWSIAVVLLSAVLLKQKLRFINIFALLISFGGVIVIATKGSPFSLEFENPLGVMLALGSAVFWAFYWVLNVKDKRDNLSKLILNFFYGTILIIILNIIFYEGFSEISPNILYCIYIGFFEMGLTFIIWLAALKYASNTAKVGNIIYLSPFLSLFWINLFLGEEILPATIIGLAMIIGGIVIQSRVKADIR